MTIEKAQKDFMELIEKNGFTEVAKTTDTNNTMYHRVWTREVEVVWHGKQQDSLEVRILLSYGYPLVVVKRNGRQDPKFIRDYSSHKRAMKAIREIVRFAGFEWQTK